FGPGERAERPTLLYLGRLKRYKRIELLLDAVETLPDAVLEIAGDGDHRAAIEQEIERRGLRDRVVMHGHVDEATKEQLLQRAWGGIHLGSHRAAYAGRARSGACRGAAQGAAARAARWARALRHRPRGRPRRRGDGGERHRARVHDRVRARAAQLGLRIAGGA